MSKMKKKRGSKPGEKRGPYKKKKKNVIFQMKLCQISIQRSRQERDRLRLTVSDKVNDFEQQLIAMQPTSDNLLPFNEIKSKRKAELNRLRNQKSRQGRTKEKKTIDNEKDRLYKKKVRAEEHRTESMKRSDNLKQNLRRCYLKILDLTSNNREKYILKRIQLSQEYEEVSRKIILEQQG